MRSLRPGRVEVDRRKVFDEKRVYDCVKVEDFGDEGDRTKLALITLNVLKY